MIQAVTFSSPNVGGHLTIEKGHLTIPKRSQRIARNLGFPEIRGFPFLSYILRGFWSCFGLRAHLTRIFGRVCSTDHPYKGLRLSSPPPKVGGTQWHTPKRSFHTSMVVIFFKASSFDTLLNGSKNVSVREFPNPKKCL